VLALLIAGTTLKTTVLVALGATPLLAVTVAE